MFDISRKFFLQIYLIIF